MISVTEAKALGASDKAEGLDPSKLEDIAESFVENVGGKAGSILANAYRKGAGIL
jgi:hypothetical protein